MYKGVRAIFQMAEDQRDVTYSNGIIAVDPDTAMDRARAARDETRKNWERLSKISEHHSTRRVQRCVRFVVG